MPKPYQHAQYIDPNVLVTPRFRKEPKYDWHDIMLFVCSVVVIFAILAHDLMQGEEIENLTKELNACQVYQEFVVDQM